MSIELDPTLTALRSDYERCTGTLPLHFYCPILYTDQCVDLCRAHIVNAAFPDSSQRCTIQRTDVDNFYGTRFESDFVDIQYKGIHLAERALLSSKLSKRFGPKLRIGEDDVEYFSPTGTVPNHFTEALITGPSGSVRLGLKIHPDEAMTQMSKGWSISIEKDIRMAALVSVLKAAHLTMFDMLGYQYALSTGGQLLGWDVLGKFFLNNRGLPRLEVLANAKGHFKEFTNMVRPLLNPPADLQGTVSDNFVFVCHCDSEIPWGMIVFIRTSKLIHAALVPVLETTRSAERFVEFLKGSDCMIRAKRCRFVDGQWHGAREEEILAWPAANLLE